MPCLPVRDLVLAVTVALACTVLAGCSGSSGAAATAAAPPGDSVDPQPPATDSPPPDDEPNSSEPPTVSLTAADEVVESGQPVQLSWSSENADGCTASGGWSGSRGTAGNAQAGPIDASTTFTLTCTGPGGNAVAMLSVSVLGIVTLNWQAPSQNVDGTPLDDLAGYRIYYGPDSRDYSDQVAINGSGVTSQDVLLASGSYYFAMTALDAEGNESAYSNEVVKVVN